MNPNNEIIGKQEVTYCLEISGRIYVIENVPARVNLETGEQFLSPDTVERLHQIILNEENPVRFVEVPIYDFAA